jgi:hypothetical protein
MESTMNTLVYVVVAATVAIPALTEAASASQAWHLSAGQVMAAARHAVLSGLLVMIGALTVLIVAQTADAAQRGLPPGTAYNTQANPHYGFGPVVRVGPTDVVSGDRMIGRDPDPFIRNQMLRNYR